MKGFRSPKVLRQKLSQAFGKGKKQRSFKVRDASPVSQTESSTTSVELVSESQEQSFSPIEESEELFAALYGQKEPESIPQARDAYGKEDNTPINAADLYKDAPAEDASKYGYGDEDVTPINPPDLHKDSKDDEPTNYGYGKEDNTPINAADLYKDVPPEDPAKFGYGDEKPKLATPTNPAPPQITKTVRRSSMKGSSGPRRRASIGYTGEIELRLPGRQGPVKKKLSISFDSKVKVKSVAPISSMTENSDALWFQDDEYDRMKQKSFEIVDRVELGMTGGKKYCTRGLEKLMQKNQEASMIKKYDAWDAVMNEQFSQRESGTFDDQNIANALMFTTLNSQREANLRAQQDAEDIEKYVRTTRQRIRRMSM